MVITHAEARLKALLVLWLILFGGGVIVMTVAAWLPLGTRLYAEEPLLAFTWMGQALLFLCTFFVFNGLRDNELCAPAIAWFKLVSGTAMLLFLLSGAPSTGSALPVVGGGLLDYVMGGLTFGLWLSARRSRVVRMPFVVDIEPGVEEEPTSRAKRALRLSLAIGAGVFALTSLGLFVAPLFSRASQSPTFKIAAANASAVYAALTFLSFLAAETPRRRAYTLEVVVLVSLLGAATLIFWSFRFPLGSATRVLFWMAAAVHLLLVVVTVIFNAAAARAERPTRFLGPWLHRVLEKFAEVIIHGSAEVITPREIAEAGDALLADAPGRRKYGIKMALAFIELGAFPLKGRLPMSRQGRLERQDYLESVFRRGRGLFRDVIKVKQIVSLIYYSDERTYKAIGFVQFPERQRYRDAEAAGRLPVGEVRYPEPVDASVLETDICVIGSGAAGAIVATRLAEAGKRVVVLEEGPFLKRDRTRNDEREMQLKAFREGGLQLTLDFDMYVLQGRCVGGSTFVNNGVCFDMPRDVLRQWHKLGACLSEERLAQAVQRVRDEIGIHKLEEHPELVEKGSFKFVEGCRRLGLEARWFEVNLDGCLGCGYCTSGCPYEKKMSVDLSYIPRALKAGAVLVPECRAERIVTQGSSARAVECRRADGSTLTVNAKQIVVACGAIGSSLLLRRSGIKRNVGTRLSFNVGSWVFAEFREPIDSFDGIQMCAYHDRPSYFLETFAMAPGAFSVAMPGWFQDHFDNMQRYRYFAVAGALVGTQPVGRVVPSWVPGLRDVLSPIDFQLPPADLRKLRDGIRQVCRIWLSAGALRVIPASFQSLEFVSLSQVDRLDEVIVEPDDVSFGSSHPQGGNPMSDDPELGAVDASFRVHGFDNLFVCDASVFPTSIKVNPQLTIMALADYAAEIIASA